MLTLGLQEFPLEALANGWTFYVNLAIPNCMQTQQPTPLERSSFLKNYWKPYPNVLPSMRPSKEWFFGQVREVTGEKLVIDHHDAFLCSFEASRCDINLGPSISAENLRRGDKIAIYKEVGGEPWSAFLLSPNLGGDYCVQNEQQWRGFVHQCASYFVQSGLQPWQTDTLVDAPGVDAHVDFMQVRGVRTDRQWYLPTSPELGLKKALAGGATDIFEIKQVYRDDDPSKYHKSQFTMAEWYRCYADKWVLLDDILGLIKSVRGQSLNYTKLSIAELFAQSLNVKLTPTTFLEELKDVAGSLGLDIDPSDDWDDVFHRIFVQEIEPKLSEYEALVLYDYPSTQRSLSRLTTEGWADRFEFYVQGVELANAYQEETNPKFVLQTIAQQQKLRVNAGKAEFPIDKEFIKAMQGGFPPCAGVALGLDRLYGIICSGDL